MTVRVILTSVPPFGRCEDRRGDSGGGLPIQVPLWAITFGVVDPGRRHGQFRRSTTRPAKRTNMSLHSKAHSPLAARLPFFFGWVLIIAAAFVTVALSVTARTAFSLMFPPIVDEFGWDLRAGGRGFLLLAYLVSAAIEARLSGRIMDAKGPRFVIEIGVLITAAGLMSATLIQTPWQLYATLRPARGRRRQFHELLGAIAIPAQLVRAPARLAIGIAFSGVGVGAITAAAVAAVDHPARGLAQRLLDARHPHIGRAAADQPDRLQAAAGSRPAARRCQGDGHRRRAPQGRHRRSGLGRHRLDGRARDPHGALLVAGGQLFLRRLCLVRGAGASDQVSGRDRLQPHAGCVVAGPGRHGGDPGSDRLGRALRQDRPRDLLDHRFGRLRHLLRCPARAGRRSFPRCCSTSWCCRRAYWAMPTRT